jgi:hypothetical protein
MNKDCTSIFGYGLAGSLVFHLVRGVANSALVAAATQAASGREEDDD